MCSTQNCIVKSRCKLQMCRICHYSTRNQWIGVQDFNRRLVATSCAALIVRIVNKLHHQTAFHVLIDSFLHVFLQYTQDESCPNLMVAKQCVEFLHWKCWVDSHCSLRNESIVAFCGSRFARSWRTSLCWKVARLPSFNMKRMMPCWRCAFHMAIWGVWPQLAAWDSGCYGS